MTTRIDYYRRRSGSARHFRDRMFIAMTNWTAVYVPVPEGYIAFVEELPGANTQGATLDEARENLQEAIELVLEANRTLAEESLVGKEAIRELLPIG